MRSSIVSLATIWYTFTSCVCPMRWARSVAWFCAAAFHHGSAWMTTQAPVRFRPVFPAFREIRNTGVSSTLNESTSSKRRFFGVAPVIVS